MADSVQLWFTDRWRTYHFPSKVGGLPVWLNLNNLPNRTDLFCKTCGKPLTFMLQVYANINEIESAYHRTLFMFICTNGKCYKRLHNKNFAVFRSQLRRQNDFYSYDLHEGDEINPFDPLPTKQQPMCSVCGCAASIKCFKCPEVDYCCKNHRDHDWRTNHQNVCGKKEADMRKKKAKTQILLPEYDLVMEPEQLPATEPEKSDFEKMKEFSLFMESKKDKKQIQDLPPDLDELMKRKDKAFNKFQKRIKLEPEQVLRYERGGTPLWVSSEHVPTVKDIPDCVCGAKRIFEFQVMPQLLNYLSLDSLEDSVDWGTLAVFTCSKSCENGEKGYVKEFVWKQDFSVDYQ